MPYPDTELLRAAWTGARFDLRLAFMIMAPVGLLSILPLINIIRIDLLQALVKIYLKSISFLVLLFYSFDFGHYGYLGRRIDITVLDNLINPLISARMIWESYSVPLAVLGWAIGFYLIHKIVNKLSGIINEAPALSSKKQGFMGLVLGGLIFIFGIWGTFSQYPLRWSDAFFSREAFVSALGLNPVLYFQDTKKFSNANFSLEETRRYYPRMSSYLGINEARIDSLNFARTSPGTSDGRRPNIVIIFLESVGANRMGLMGNPLNPSPNLDRLAEEGLFYKRFYVPWVGTARSVFTLVTGIPDVAMVKTSSRNPLIADQFSIINAFTDYEKYYILGGSASWANIRGLIKFNIPGITILEQEDLTSPRLDVWGISDHNLFQEAHVIFKKVPRDKPFFAVIQTATNHKPYSISPDLKNFKVLNPAPEELNRAGFKSADQYNAMRALDHALGEYFEYAREADYFDNTLFVFFGDHGTSDPWARHMPPADYELVLRSYHVPFIIHGTPLKFKGETRAGVTTLADIMPTLAALAGLPYENRTMGRDISAEQVVERYALLIGRSQGRRRMGVIGEKYYLNMYTDGTDPRLYDIFAENPALDLKDEFPEVADRYEEMTHAMFETAKYMLYHNQKVNQ
ncbi:MAG: LTA synthase family protein [Candidatus Neomarinimicrobiota bacterium]